MTNEERIELLKEVARVAPKEWDADHCTISGEPCVQFEALNYEVLRFSDNDIENAPAIIVMLDAMEARDLGGQGPEVLIELVGSNGSWVCRRVVCPHSDQPYIAQTGEGSTRAEAVARAFVKVFDYAAENKGAHPA